VTADDGVAVGPAALLVGKPSPVADDYRLRIRHWRSFFGLSFIIGVHCNRRARVFKIAAVENLKTPKRFERSVTKRCPVDVIVISASV